jgi:hypothetical protein
MIQLISLWQPNGALFWGRLSGDWGRCEWARAQALLARLPLDQGSRVVLDLSGTRHMDFRDAAQLIAVAQRLQSRGAQIVITGLSDYLVKIVELGSGLEGRAFIEQYGLHGSPLPGPADPSARTGMPCVRGLDPHGLGVACLN